MSKPNPFANVRSGSSATAPAQPLKNYQANFDDGRSIPIGQFQTIQEAQAYADSQFGPGQSSVIQMFSTSATAIDPMWLLLGLVLLVVWANNNSGGKG